MTEVIPERFRGLRVLLIEPDRLSLQLHANVLKQNSYRVTITTEPSNGLSMIINGHTYDCVLIDADICESGMKAFLHQVLRHEPQMSIILMASDDIHLRIPKEALESEAVLHLLKPCSVTDICNVWQHICRNRIPFEYENVANVKPSAINDITTIKSNIVSGNFSDHQAMETNSQENGAIYTQVTYEDLFPDDHDQDGDGRENIGAGLAKESDEGKQPAILKRKKDQPVEDDKYPKKRKEIKTRVTWKGELDEKFKNALKELGDQAQAKAILKHMNVPGLTRFHVASHLQKHQKKRKSIEASIAALTIRGTDLLVESFANERYRQSTQSDDDIQSSSLLKSPLVNLAGITYMAIKNINARFGSSTVADCEGFTDFQVTRQNLDLVSSHSGTPLDFENLDSIPFWSESADFSIIQEFLTEENDSLAAQVQQSDLEYSMGFLNVDDGNLFNEQFYF